MKTHEFMRHVQNSLFDLAATYKLHDANILQKNLIWLINLKVLCTAPLKYLATHLLVVEL